MGELVARAFDGVVTVQPHLHRTNDLSDVFGGKPALALPAIRAIAVNLWKSVSPSTIIIGPDEESAPLARGIAARLGLRWVTATKHRTGDSTVQMSLPSTVMYAAQPIVIVDDVISTGGTISALAQSLRDVGAESIDVYAAHALFNEKAACAMADAGVRRVVSLDSIPHATNSISVIDIIAEALGSQE